jgi:hypothetical protein
VRRRSGLAAPSVPLPRARARAHSATAVINNQASTAPIAVEAGCAPRRRTRTITTSAPSQRGSGIVQRRLPPTLDATGGGTRWTTGTRGRTTERWRYGRRSSPTGARSTPPYGRVAEGCGAAWPRWRCIRHSVPLGIQQDDGGPERRATPPDCGGLRGGRTCSSVHHASSRRWEIGQPEVGARRASPGVRDTALSTLTGRNESGAVSAARRRC